MGRTMMGNALLSPACGGWQARPAVSEFAPSAAKKLLNTPRPFCSAQICRSTCASTNLAHVSAEKHADFEVQVRDVSRSALVGTSHAAAPLTCVYRFALPQAHVASGRHRRGVDRLRTQ